MKNHRKHAYLIICHGEISILKKTLELLDSEYHDFYIHLDKKGKNLKRLQDGLRRTVKVGNIVFLKSKKISWGGYSLTKCELLLLKKATKGNYEYYHLLSGCDLPLKSSIEIYNYFHERRGTEFVQYQSKKLPNYVAPRTGYYWIPQKYLHGRTNPSTESWYKHLIQFQKKIGINRHNPKDPPLYKGVQWFSITNDLAREVLSREDWIKNRFSFTLCSDEIFLHTVLMDSQYKDKLVQNNFKDNYRNIQRFIDWKRGHPYIFKKEDYGALTTSDFLFARKFDPSVDSEIIDMIYAFVKESANLHSAQEAQESSPEIARY